MARDILNTRMPLVEGMPPHVTIDYKVLPSGYRTAAPYGRRAREHGNRPSARGRAAVLDNTGRCDA